MIPYYSPNLHFRDLIKALGVTSEKGKVIDFFRQYTGKQYILLTSSCRSALYLAYRAIGRTGIVITTPLTCIAALEPILLAGLRPFFIDIDPCTLNMDMDLLHRSPDSQSVALQLIHLGGAPVNLDKALKLAESRDLLVVEDCAQAFGAKYNNRNVGSFGDIACFSLIKNAYGIGGGILATNDRNIYEKALKTQNDFSSISRIITIYRCVRAILESQRQRFGREILLNMLLKMAKSKNNENPTQNEEAIKKELKKPAGLFFKIFCVQADKFDDLHIQRVRIARNIIKKLTDFGLTSLIYDSNNSTPSFVKLYIHDPRFYSSSMIRRLNEKGIECMHLEHKHKSYFQPRLDSIPKYREKSGIDKCKNYQEIHGSIMSLPIFEKMSKRDVEEVIDRLLEVIKNE